MIFRATLLTAVLGSVALTLPAVAFAQAEVAEQEAAAEVVEETTEDAAATQAQASAAMLEEKDFTIDPSIKAGPPDGQEKVNTERLALIRKGKQFQHKVNTRIGRYMTAAMNTAEESNPEEGIALIAKLNPKRLNPNERASIYRVEAMLHYSAGDLDNTVASFRKSIAEDILPVAAETDIRFNIAQLLAGGYKWEETIAQINEWFRYTDEPTPIAYYLLGIANFQLGNTEYAIVNTEEALRIAEKPKEGWLQLLAALYVQRQDYKKAAPVLESLVMQFPKKAYWVQLSLIYAAKENYRGALAVQQAAYTQGLLTEDKELRRLARSYLYKELPHPAAKVLAKGIDDGIIEPDSKALELLANSWIAAREFEKSLPPLIEAAKVAETGNLYVRLGQVYLQKEDWGTAAARFEDALKKGDLTTPGNAQLLLGIAYYNNNQVFRAKSSFIKAADYEQYKTNAEQWISHIEREAKTS
ncbi:MAG: hypothetical protein ACI8W3_000775 [Myxococcota bacterium]|jgi:hypothetical protein